MEETTEIVHHHSAEEGITLIEPEVVVSVATDWGLKVLTAILIFLIGKWVASKLTSLLRAGMKRREIDPALTSFLGSLVFYAMMAAVVISAIGQLGIRTTSFVAVLGAAGLAVGLALQGSLSNFAAGTLIMLFRPFKIGDVIEAGGTLGIVEEIGVLMTVMKSPDNRRIIMPNSQVMGGTITNITANPQRRIDLEIGISYSDDIDKAKAVINDILANHPKILKDPAPVVEVWDLGDSSVDLIVRPWVEKADWFPVRCELLPLIKKRLEAEGLSIPFPQRDVHLFQK